ncbi:MAG: hypothetical protein ACI80K_003522 [Paracoccaceae bacterium]|jgi:hypothetical protein
MSANFDDNESGPFDGGHGDHFESPGRQAPAQGMHGSGVPRQEHALDDLDDLEDFNDYPGPVKPEASGLELVGGVLFLVGCLPAAAVAKAILDGTNLAAPGLGGTAALAAKVSHWLGPWAALATAASIAVLGALMVLGSLRTEPLRRVAGVIVAGLGLAAIMGALHPATAGDLLGGGGQIGLGTGGELASFMGTWAGVMLGVAVMAGAIWLGFVQAPAEFDEDDGFGPIVERDELPRGAAVSPGAALAKAAGAAATVGAAAAAAGASLFRRQPRTEGEVIGNRANRQRRVSNKKVRRPGAPATLGDALARGGTEGVSHDEAAALAPDDKTLAYMEDVWRRASHSMDQPEPIPASPYPEDVRLKGGIPDGAVPFQPRPSEPGQSPEPSAPAYPSPSYGVPPQGLPPGSTPAVTPVGGPADYGVAQHHAPRQDVAPFDFDDELSAPKPLNQASPPTAPLPNVPLPAAPSFAPYGQAAVEPLATDPFGGSGASGGISDDEAEAYKSAVLREGASATGPSDLPDGVTPFVPKSREAEAAEAEAEAAAQAAAGMAEASAEAFTEVPGPSGMGTPVPGASGGLFPGSGSVMGESPIAKQAMQAGAMPASVSPPPRPAWEQGYDEEDEVAGQLSSDLMETIPDVNESGRWQRRDDGADEGLEYGESEAEMPSMSALDELLAQVEASGAGLGDVEAEVPVLDTPEPEPVAEAEAEIEPELFSEVELEAEAEPDVEPEAEAEAATEVPESEAAEVAVEDHEESSELEEPEAPEVASEVDLEVDAEEEAEDSDSEDEDSEEAELEEVDGEEEEYEYVDEDGNPIDPADLGEEYEFVEEDEEEDEDDSEEEDSEEEESEEEDSEEESEYEEYDEDEDEEDEEEDAEEAELDDAGEAEEAEDEGAVDVILEPQAPPRAAPAAAEPVAAPPAKASVAPLAGPSEEPHGAPISLSDDGQRLLDAGRLIVNKDRAAVSVIQKGFDVEFAEACSILEELFGAGLIGPYQEGKKRAILLSLVEWEGRFAHS